jgi:divalent metal cation (Fe/Co/Zn/Cd) transporter
MDGVDPELVETAEAALAAEPGVTEVRSVKMRWIGHRLRLLLTFLRWGRGDLAGAGDESDCV